MLFARPKITSQEIVKIIFQEDQSSIFFKLIHQDDDDDLNMTLDTLISMAQIRKDKLFIKKHMQHRTSRIESAFAGIRSR